MPRLFLECQLGSEDGNGHQQIILCLNVSNVYCISVIKSGCTSPNLENTIIKNPMIPHS